MNVLILVLAWNTGDVTWPNRFRSQFRTPQENSYSPGLEFDHILSSNDLPVHKRAQKCWDDEPSGHSDLKNQSCTSKTWLTYCVINVMSLENQTQMQQCLAQNWKGWNCRTWTPQGAQFSPSPETWPWCVYNDICSPEQVLQWIISTLILPLLSTSLLRSLQGFFLFRSLTESARSHRDAVWKLLPLKLLF